MKDIYKKGVWAVLLALMLIAYAPFLPAQQYIGMSGMIHVPTAEMNREGTARIGAHFLNREFTPANFTYHTTTHYLDITPFPWIEIAYTCTLMKGGNDGGSKYGFYHKDRYFSLKLRPLKEGKWWPAVAIGTNDPYSRKGNNEWASAHGTGEGSQYFSNYYIAATKHIEIKQHELALHVTYRHWKRDYNSKWNGVAGGITYRPSFCKPLRVIAEYTGEGANVGADCLLWKHLFLQVILQEGKYFSGGICFQTNLF